MTNKTLAIMLKQIFLLIATLILAFQTQAQDEFITTWQTTSANELITLPIQGGGYNFQIDWGDGTIETDQMHNVQHTYALAGTYTVKISGDFPSIYFNNGDNKLNILSVEQWGNIAWQSMDDAFYGCQNLVINATDAPDLSFCFSLENTFRECDSLNQAISHWNVSTITDMTATFREASSFNQPLNTWNVSNVRSFEETFLDASAFDQDLSSWDFSSGDNVENFLSNSGLSTENYDKLLVSLSAQSLERNRTIGVTGLTYCNATTERQQIEASSNWTFDGDTEDCSEFAFITTWETVSDGTTITIPTEGTGYDYTIDWGDGDTNTNQNGDADHIYPTAGTYIIKITGDFPRIHFNNSGNSRRRIASIEQWGDIAWEEMEEAFYGCENLVINATDAPDLSRINSMKRMFSGCASLNQDISHWDVSTINDMEELFLGASTFNQSLNDWNVAHLRSMTNMFQDASAFNQPLDTWSVSNLNNFQEIFLNASAFDQDLSAWDFSNGGSFRDFLSNSGLSVENYDKLLTSLSTQSLDRNISFGATGLIYCTATTARQKIIDDFEWTFEGDVYYCEEDEFVTTWETTSDDQTITIPTEGSGYLYQIDWGDGTIDENETGSASHEYSKAGIYTVRISGDFPRIYFDNGGDKEAILSVEQWGNMAWENMTHAFYGCENLVINATDAPDLSNCRSIQSMFQSCTSLNQDISHWNVSTIISMENMFKDANTFNQSLSTWDVGKVESMVNMFSGATAFNQDLNAWNTASVTDMNNMFEAAIAFNQAIGNWNVSQVTNMTSMFENATNFNQDIGSWEVSKLERAIEMFKEANAFNQDIGSWEVSNVRVMNSMFKDANSFDQSLGNWDISNVLSLNNMLDSTALSKENYENTLKGWASLTLAFGETLGAVGLTYCTGVVDRQFIIDNFNWTFNGDAPDCSEEGFTTTWEVSTDGESINIPTNSSYTYNYLVSWGDGNIATDFTGNASHTYNSAGTYTVDIVGTFPAIQFDNAGDKTKIQSVEQWSDIAWVDLTGAFYGCESLVINATDTINLTNCMTTESMFRDCNSFNQEINHWNVSTITTMKDMFSGAQIFNQSLDNWEVTRVKDMSGMFENAQAFNQSLNTWAVDSVTTMKAMFSNAIVFNKSLTHWNTASVTDMSEMFHFASNFNKAIGLWDLSKVENTSNMFEEATSFDQDITNWNVSNVLTMDSMFTNAKVFNQDLGNWNISNVVAMEGMLDSTALSRQNYDNTLIGWGTLTLENVGNFGVAGLSYCLGFAERQLMIDTFNWSFVGDEPDCSEGAFITTWVESPLTIPTNPIYTYDYIINWGDGTVERFTGDATHTYPIGTAGNRTVEIIGTFPAIYINNTSRSGTIALRSIDQWGDIEWLSMENAFRGCRTTEVKATDAPDLSRVSSMDYMFRRGALLTANAINTWDVSNVTSMASMFQDTDFDEDLDNWNVSRVENMKSMFSSADFFNGDISNWDVSNVTNTASMFSGAGRFNQDLSNWEVSKVTNMDFMFNFSSAFTGDLSTWNVSKVTSMDYMFRYASSFNSDLSTWKVSEVATMTNMFENATSFNADISNWNTSKVTEMSSMFNGASSFDQNLGQWDYSSVNSLSDFISNTALSTTNYDNLLMSLSNQSLTSDLSLGATGLTYCISEIERQKIIDDFGWTIDDAGLSSSCPTTTTWDGAAWSNSTPRTGILAILY